MSRPTVRTALPGLLLAGFVAILIVPQFTAGSGPMEEGGLALTAPHLVATGHLPYTAFHYLWGPGSVLFTALAYRLFGTSLVVERSVGLMFAVALTGSVFVMLRRISGLAAAVGGALVFALMTPWVALPNYGALAALGVALAAGVRRKVMVAGAAVALALYMRPDWILAALAVAAATCSCVDWRSRTRFALAAVVPLLVGYSVMAILVTPGRLWHEMVVNAVDIRGERHLPIAADGAAGLLIAVAVLALGVVVAVAVLARPDRATAAMFLGVAGVAVGLLPEYLQRADAFHLLQSALLPLAAAPAAAAYLVQRRLTVLALAPGVVAVFVAVAAWPFGLHALARQVLHGPDRQFVVRHAGRAFWYPDPRDARDARAALAAVDNLHLPPGSAVFSGPQDLRRTPYEDGAIYYLLPSLRPATSWLDMHPSVALDDASALAAQVQSAAVLVLRDYGDYVEKNASARIGADTANIAVRESFCLVERSGRYEVLRRCR